MDENLKKRMVGAIVLVSLAVIFVPMLLDDKPNDRLLSGKPIPDKPAEPDFGGRSVLPADGDFRFRQPEPVKAIELTDSEPTGAAKTPKPSSQSGKPTAWVIQVASFNDKAHAQDLVKKLRADDLPAFFKPAKVKGKPVYRVRVGPELDHKRISGMAARIDKGYKVKTAILVHR